MVRSSQSSQASSMTSFVGESNGTTWAGDSIGASFVGGIVGGVAGLAVPVELAWRKMLGPSPPEGC